MDQTEKKLNTLKQELSDLLRAYKWEEAWTKAGELSAFMKTEEVLNMPAIKIDGVRLALKQYYAKARIVNNAQKALVAVGHKLAES